MKALKCLLAIFLGIFLGVLGSCSKKKEGVPPPGTGDPTIKDGQKAPGKGKPDASESMPKKGKDLPVRDPILE
jgi:hypothetical protein